MREELGGRFPALSRHRGTIGAVVWALVLAVITLPPAFSRPAVGLDPSWLAGLNMAFLQHLQWGKGVIWTYGPFGFLDFTTFFAFNTWIIALAVALLVHLAFFATLVGYIRAVGGTWWRWALMGVVLFLPLSAFPSVESELTVIAFLLLFLSVTDARLPGLPLALVSGLTLGLLLTIKGTGIPAAGALWLAYTLFTLATRKVRLPLALTGSVVLSFAVFWVLAGQPLGNVPAYVRGSYEIISGYSAAMSLLRDVPVPIHHVSAQVAFGALAVTSSVIALGLALWRRDSRVVLMLLLATPLLFLEFKEGYVRFGDRQLVFYSLAAVIEGLVLISLLPGGVRHRWIVAGQAGAVLVPCALLVSGLALATGMVPTQGFYVEGCRLVPTSPLQFPITTAPKRLASYPQAAQLLASSTARRELTDEVTRTIQNCYELSSSSVVAGAPSDVVPWDIEVAYAYQLNWDPRPVLQSYQAYTAYLDQADAGHFRATDAPANVMLAYQSIDGRYPLFDEPAVFRALYENYQVIGQDQQFLLLRRNAAPAPPSIHVVGRVRGHIGERIAVPSVTPGTAVYAAVQVPYSLIGRGFALLFQPSELHISLETSTGRTGPYRFIPAVASDGLPLTAYVPDAAALRGLLQHEAASPISAFWITANRERDYRGVVDVTFYTPG